MKKRGLILFLALTLLVSCAPAETPPASAPDASPAAAVAAAPEAVPVRPLDFAAFQSEVCGARRAATASTEPIDLSAWTEDFAYEGAFTEAELDLIAREREPVRSVTLEEALEDVDTCFLLLETTYGAYDYFGGGEVFRPLRDRVRAALTEADAKVVLNAGVMEELLAETLGPVLKDGHFSVGDTNLSDAYDRQMYYVPGLYFTNLDGLDPDYVKPTVAPDGSIQYWFAALSRDGTDLPDSQGRYSQLDWTAAERLPRGETAFEEQEVDGLPVLVSRRMSVNYDHPEQEGQLERFASCGGEYRDAPLLVLDVRANPGGTDDYVMAWFEDWAGHAAESRRSGGQKVSPLACRAMPDYLPTDRRGEWMTYHHDGVWTEPAGDVFVLTDKGTASSGETAVEFLRTADRTVFVGGPTAGCALVPNNLHFYLPHSGLELFFGTGLRFVEGLENRDGVGYLPDLWVNPPDALDAVVRLCGYYGLNESPPRLN